MPGEIIADACLVPAAFSCPLTYVAGHYSSTRMKGHLRYDALRGEVELVDGVARLCAMNSSFTVSGRTTETRSRD